MGNIRLNSALGLCVSVVVLLLHQSAIVQGRDEDPLIKSCSKTSSCTCETPNLGDIDLQPLAKRDGTPWFEEIRSGIQEYSWNPCVPFNQGDCKNVAICQKSTLPNVQYYNLGTQNTAQFMTNDKGLQLVYTANSWGPQLTNPSEGPWDFWRSNVSVTYTRLSYVRLVCDLDSKPGVLKAEGEDRGWPGKFYFTLTSYHACPSYLKPKPQSTTSLSTGSCILIVCFVMIAVYLVVGSAMQVFMFKRSGVDAIPNKTFWASLPGLVKDGTVYVLRSRRNTGYSEV